MKINLTPRAVERLKPRGERFEVKDAGARGLYLRVEPNGRKSWRYRYMVAGKLRTMTLGTWTGDKTGMSLNTARALAWQHREAILRGDDPGAQAQEAAARQRATPTVEDFVEEYIERYAKPRKKTWKPDEQMLRYWVVPRIGRMKIDKVTRRDVVAVIDAVRDAGNSRQPGKVLAVTRRMFRFAVERGVIEATPVQYVSERQPPPARKAMDIETARVWWARTGEVIDAAGHGENVPVHPTVALALRLLLLTGQRPGEVAALHADDLDLDGAEPVWRIPAEKRKHGKAHAVALTRDAVAAIRKALAFSREGVVFPLQTKPAPISTGTMSRVLKEVLGPNAPTPHAARHTVATELEGLGFDELKIARVLGHQSTGITGRVYVNRKSLASQHRALAAWENHLLERGGAKVRPIREARA